MKKKIAAATLLLASGGSGHYLFHKGGMYNPHVIEVTAQVLLETGTDSVRYCTFRPAAPFDLVKGDYFSLFLPENKEVKYKAVEDVRVEHIFAKCTKTDVDVEKVVLSLTEPKALLELCPTDADATCQALRINDGPAYINRLAKKKG